MRGGLRSAEGAGATAGSPTGLGGRPAATVRDAVFFSNRLAGTRADWPRSDKTVPLDHNEAFGPMKPANLVVIADRFTERAGGRPHTDVRLANRFDPCLVKPRLTGAVGRDVENPVTDLGPDSAPVSHGCFPHPPVHPGALTGKPARPAPGSVTPPGARAGRSRRGCQRRSSSGRTSAAGCDARRTATPGRWGAGHGSKPGRRNGHSGPRR